MNYKKIGFLAGHNPEASEAQKCLQERYEHVSLEEADVVIALGGDGFMLRALHMTMELGIPVYGMNRGSVGFLMNTYQEEGLLTRLKKSQAVDLHPLRMITIDSNGRRYEALAINEVAMLRETHLAAKLKIKVDNIERMNELICDGMLVATPAGSTAYNASAHGPIVPIGAELLALTPISAYRPRRWRGALLPQRAAVEIEVLSYDERPVSAVADYAEFRDVKRVTISQDRSKITKLLFDPEHNLEERIIKEQFLP